MSGRAPPIGRRQWSSRGGGRNFLRAVLLPGVLLLAPALPGWLVLSAHADSSVSRAARVLADRDRPGSVRVEAAHSLADVPPGPDRDPALFALVETLADPLADVRAAVAGALARMHDPRAVPPLVRRVQEERDPTVLAALLLAIGAVGGPQDARIVVAATGHPNARVRAAAATSLGDLGGEAVRPALLELLCKSGDDPDWAVRGAVLLALARRGVPTDSGVILIAYRDGGGSSQWFARAALASAVAALDPDPVPILDRLCADPDARVSSAAALGFVRAGRPEEVVRRLSDSRAGVRAAAAAAIAGAELRKSIPALRALATGDPERSVRWTAVLALSRLDDPAADDLLIEGLRSDDPQVWATALAECQAKTGLETGRDADAWKAALAARRKGTRR